MASMQEAIQELKKQLDRARKDPNKVWGLSTGLNSLDEYTGGLHAGQMVIIGGRPGQGKTALAHQMACTIARRIQEREEEGVVAFVCTEMQDYELAQREVCRLTGISAKHQNSGMTTPIENALIDACLEDIQDLPIEYYGGTSVVSKHVIDWLDTLDRHYGLTAVFVDYIQKVQPVEGAGRYDAVTRALADFEGFRKRANVPLVLLSQLRRPEKPDAKPDMTQLRDSGEIEAYGNAVILIHNPAADNTTPPELRRTELILAKNRQGPIGTIPLKFEAEKFSFVDMEEKLHSASPTFAESQPCDYEDEEAGTDEADERISA